MSNTIKKCKFCKGTGLRERPEKLSGKDALYTCPECQGLGTPIYDEEFDNARAFMEEVDKDYDDLDND